jgi:hypothetical protein
MSAHEPNHGPSPKASSNHSGGSASMSEVLAGTTCVAVLAILAGLPLIL